MSLAADEPLRWDVNWQLLLEHFYQFIYLVVSGLKAGCLLFDDCPCFCRNGDTSILQSRVVSFQGGHGALSEEQPCPI